MAVETNARIEFSVASVEEWEKVNPKLHQGEPVFAKKTSGKYILKVGAPGGSTYKNAVVVWDQDDAETKISKTHRRRRAQATRILRNSSILRARVQPRRVRTRRPHPRARRRRVRRTRKPARQMRPLPRPPLRTVQALPASRRQCPPIAPVQRPPVRAMR